MKALGDELRMLRKKKGLSLREAQEELDISFVYISNIERGLKSPSVKVLNKYAEKLDAPLGKLMLLRLMQQHPEINKETNAKQALIELIAGIDDEAKILKIRKLVDEVLKNK